MKNDEPLNYYNKAQNLKNNGNFSGALEALEIANTLKPDFFEARVNSAEACRILGKTAQAIENMEVAIYLKPDFFAGHNALGLLFYSIASFELAIKSFKNAISINPDFFEAYYNLGNCLRDVENFDEAITCFKTAISINPRFIQALTNCGEALLITGMIEEAEHCFLRALDIDKSSNIVISNLLLTQNYNPDYSQKQLFRHHRKYASLMLPCIDPFPAPVKKMCTTDNKLRIGYVSGDFRNHPVSYFIAPLFAYCNKHGFDIFCYSNTKTPDSKTVYFRTQANAWHSICDMTDLEAAEKIRSDKIDILVDLSGHSADNRLGVFYYRPSPIQVTYLGYPNSTGMDSMGYRLTDSICDPTDGEAYYSETLHRLPGGFCCFGPPENAPAVAAAPVTTNNCITFGSTHLLARLNNQVLDLWAILLKRIPSSRLRIVRNTLKGNAATRILDRLTSHGIEASRISLINNVPAHGHLEIYKEIDVLLDTFPWSGHTSACEALFMGVPVISLRGDRFAGRMVSSILSSLCMTDFIAESKEDYVVKSEQIASDIPGLCSLRATLRERMLNSPLCDGKNFTKNIEAAYRRLWDRYCGGAPQFL